MKKQLVLAMAAVLACASLVPAQDAPSGSKATKGGGFYNYGMLLGVPPFIEDVETLSRDAKELFRDGIIDSVALSCPIVPRGDPPINKVDAFAEMFRALRKRLEGSGIPTGILLYATMGHGGSSTMPSPFQKIILGRNGKVSPFFCPEDEKFCEYIGQNIRKLGQEKPDFFIVDDDARLLTLRQGCFCPLHVDRFNRLHSTRYSSEELRKLVFTNTALAHQYDELLRQTMENYFRGVRKAIDDISPDIHCGLFACVQEARYYGKFAEILAGKTGHPMVRVNNGRYLSDRQRDVPEWLRKTAGQMVLFGNRFHILSETDTAPHNRYSMSAYSLLQHIVLSYLEGCKGGSLWITSVQNSDVFASGLAYRDVLRKHKGQLQELRKMDVAWAGPGVPVATEGVFDFPNKQSTVNSWEFIFGRMGIPFTFTSDGASCNALTARQIQELSVQQLETIFRTSPVLVDGDAALALTEQGHADWLGCQAAKEMSPVALEIWNGKKIRGSGTECRHLLPLPKGNAFQPKVFEQLSAFATPALQLDQPPQTIAPAALHTVNCFGQHVITMARSTNFGDGGFACAVWMNEIRKAQLIDFLNKLNPLGLYYTEDAELLLRYGFQGKQRIAYVANLGFDPLDAIPLRGEWTKNFTEVQTLDLDGQWKTVPATKTSEGTLQLQLPLAAHRVVIFRFLMAAAAAAGTHGAEAPARRVLCWGDSVTEGMAMPRGKDYPSRLQALLGPGYEVLNSGDGGENTITIPARQGAVPLATAAEIKFAAGESAVQVGDASDNGFHTPSGDVIKLTAALGRQIPVNPVRIGGGEFTLFFRDFRWNSPTNKIGYTLWLRRGESDAGRPLAIPAGSPVKFASADVAPGAYCEIFFMGANGGWDRKVEKLVAQIRAMVARRGEDRPYLVIVPYWRGFPQKDREFFKAAFGRHAVEFPVADALCYRNRPDVHLNANGYALLAELLHARGAELGYWPGAF